MCVNPKVKKATSTASEINHDCQKLNKDKKCRFRAKLEGFSAPSNETGGTYGYQPVMDMEDLISMGNTHKVCPFYFTRSLVEEAELVLVPYNYLFDKDARTTTLADIPWDNAVVIFDEAHNLESFASESASFDLTSTDIAGCVGEVQRGLGYIQAMPHLSENHKLKPENCLRIKAMFLSLEEHILRLGNQSAYMGEFMIDIFEKGCGITHANYQIFIGEVRKLTELFLEVQGGSNSRGAPRLEHFIGCIKRVFGEPTEARCLAKAKSYRVHVTPKQTATTGSNHVKTNVGRTVSYWCFAPAEAMRELAGLDIRSILVTSGTLSPLESYAMELDLPFPHRLENPHIIKDDQIHVRVVGRGVSGKLLSSSYERRQDAEYFNELGNTLVSLAKVIPGGMLVFFPSYGVMEACLERWGGPITTRSSGSENKPSNFFAARRRQSATGSARYSFPHNPPSTFNTETSNPWKRMLAIKAIVIEPKSTTDLADAIAEFHKFLNLPKSTGCALFGVCRGKISEGIDFADDMCRAVIITGLPFAPSFDPKVKMKREFLDNNRASESVLASDEGGFGDKKIGTSVMLSGNEWYTQQAHRAVNQAIGRVIRNRQDYGAVLLLDARFSQPRNQQGLSKWVRPHIQDDEGMGRAITSLVQFYRNAKQKSSIWEQSVVSVPQTPNQIAVILRYEDDGNVNQMNEDEFTKVAIIKRAEEAADCQSTEQSLESSKMSNLLTEEEVNSPSNTNYIPPERIVARIDTQRLENAIPSKDMQSNEFVDSKQSKQKSEENLEKLYGGNKVGSTNEKQTVFSKSVAASEAKSFAEASTSQQYALQFFKQAQSCMSASELASVKKAIVAMKNSGQKRDKETYLRSAREVVRIIIHHEDFEDMEDKKDQLMLFLFFQLLPSKYRPYVQKAAMLEVMESSKLGQLLKASEEQDTYKLICKNLIPLLSDLWCNNDEASPLPIKSFLERAQRVSTLFGNCDEKTIQKKLEYFAKLIPSRYYAAINALMDELKASQRIRRIKESEKRREKEVDSDRCERVLSRHLSQRKADSSSLSPTRCVDQSEAKEVEPKKRPNPFLSSENSESLKDCGLSNRQTAKVGRIELLQTVQSRGTQPPSSVSDSFSMKKFLDLSEADTFSGNGASRKLEIQSSAPSKLRCPICENYCSKVRVCFFSSKE